MINVDDKGKDKYNNLLYEGEFLNWNYLKGKYIINMEITHMK